MFKRFRKIAYKDVATSNFCYFVDGIGIYLNNLEIYRKKFLLSLNETIITEQKPNIYIKLLTPKNRQLTNLNKKHEKNLDISMRAKF